MAILLCAAGYIYTLQMRLKEVLLQEREGRIEEQSREIEYWRHWRILSLSLSLSLSLALTLTLFDPRIVHVIKFSPNPNPSPR